MPRAIFLDRDGVIVEPVPDPETGRPESPYAARDVALVDGVAEALRALASERVVVVSNQPAAAKGKATRADLEAVHARTVELLAAADIALADWRYCLHSPGDDCACRKPRPGLLIAAAREHDLDLGASWMVGDSDSDVLAGAAAGCRTALVEHPGTAHRRPDTCLRPTLRASSLLALVPRLQE